MQGAEPRPIFKLCSYNWTVVLEKTPESPLDSKKIKPFSPEGNQSWMFFGRIDAEAPILWWEELTHWKRLWCWEGLKAGGEGADRGWDGWMASPTRWTWVWVTSRSWWWTGRPGMLRFMGSQRAGHGWVTELNWYIYIYVYVYVCVCVCVCDRILLSHKKEWNSTICRDVDGPRDCHLEWRESEKKILLICEI